MNALHKVRATLMTLLASTLVFAGAVAAAPSAEAALYTNNCRTYTTSHVNANGFVMIKSKTMNIQVQIRGGGTAYAMTAYSDRYVAIDIDHNFSITCPGWKS